MLELRHQAGLTHRLVRGAALTAFAFYLVWNVVWLTEGRLPPSILLAFTGLPCPTTGAYRSVLYLLHGDWRQSLLFNPFTIAYVSLAVCSLSVFLTQTLRRRRLVLSPTLASMWFVTLAIGWAAKFALGRRYW